MTESKIKTTAGLPRETSHADLAGGVDIDVEVTLPRGVAFTVGTTLHRAKRGFGTDCTLWMADESMLHRFQAMTKRFRRQVEDAIEFAARKRSQA